MSDLSENDTDPLNHVVAIQKYIEVISCAEDMHALIVEGAPGWGKTTAVESALELAGMQGVHLGAYSTPLNLYNFLFHNLDQIIIVDDCAGLFNDRSAMAILKAATWPSLGKKRIVKWGSTSNLATVAGFEFSGKLIIVCNAFPKTPDGDAIRSRGYVRRVNISLSEARELILNASKDPTWFKNLELASEVADFLINRLNEVTLPEISFRTLKKGYRLAEVHKKSWKLLLADAIPGENTPPEVLVADLAKQDLAVKEQERIFQEKTGLKRRSFYNYRKSVKPTLVNEN